MKITVASIFLALTLPSLALAQPTLQPPAANIEDPAMTSMRERVPSTQTSFITVVPVGDGTYTIRVQLRNADTRTVTGRRAFAGYYSEDDNENPLPQGGNNFSNWKLTGDDWVYEQNYDPSVFTPAVFRFVAVLTDGIVVSETLPQA